MATALATNMHAATAPASAPFRIRSVLLPLTAIIIGVFMAVLDATAVNVAVPSLVRSFHASLSTIQWVVTGYTLAQAAVIPLAGWTADRFGAKHLFLLSVVLFTVGSALCATAQSSGMLITFRVLQGLGGGFVMPLAMAYVYRLSPPERVGAIMGIMGIPILFAPAIGPVLAGWLVQYHDWRWIFLINLPVGVIGVTLGLRGLPTTARQRVGRLDLPGFILAPLAFAALCYGVTEGSASWTSRNTIVGIAVGCVALVAFVVAELRTANPLLELRVFRSIHFSVAILTQWVGQFALFGTLFLVPYFMQSVRGYGAFDTGLTMLPQAIGAALFMPLGGVLFDRIGARPLVVLGSMIMAVAAFILARVGITTQGRDLIVPLGLYGVGMGLMFMSLNTHLINTAPRNLVSRVTSLTNALMQVISSITVAGLTTILTSRPSYQHATSQIAAAQRLAAQHGHASAPATVVSAPPPVIGRLFATAFDNTFTLMAVIAVVGAAMGLLLSRRAALEMVRQSGDQHGAVGVPAAI